jgi:hypothetical protein
MLHRRNFRSLRWLKPGSNESPALEVADVQITFSPRDLGNSRRIGSRVAVRFSGESRRNSGLGQGGSVRHPNRLLRASLAEYLIALLAGSTIHFRGTTRYRGTPLIALFRRGHAIAWKVSRYLINQTKRVLKTALAFGVPLTLHDRRRASTHVMAPEYDLSIAEVSDPVALRSVSQVDRLSSVAALLKRL